MIINLGTNGDRDFFYVCVCVCKAAQEKEEDEDEGREGAGEVCCGDKKEAQGWEEETPTGLTGTTPIPNEDG